MNTLLKFKYSTESIGCGEEENFMLKICLIQKIWLYLPSNYDMIVY